MNVKKLIGLSIAGLFVIPALASAYTYSPNDYPGARETLVEGHTVFAVVQASLCYDYGNNTTVKCPSGLSADFDVSYDKRVNVTVQRMGAAVAVLVRDRVKPYYEPPTMPGCSSNRDLVATLFYENPGVLWFNDQFLVGDDLDLLEAEVDANADVCARVSIMSTKHADDWRYPCGGWVFATQSGNPDPREYMSQWTYNESYRIEDPNGYVWIVDKFGIGGTDVTVPYFDEMHDLGLDNDTPAYDYDDASDGDVRAVAGSLEGGRLSYHLGYYNLWTVPVLGRDTIDAGPTSGQSCAPYEDKASHDEEPYGDGYDGTARLYNAVLFFFFEDLVKGALYSPIGHLADLERPADPVKIHGDGAPDDGDVSGCQAGTEWECDDPVAGTRTDDDEGNSHPYNPNSNVSGPKHVHPTASVDLYFSNVPAAVLDTANRTWAIYDTVGSGAPFHDHAGGELFDDRMRIDPCLDLDYDAAVVTYTYNGGGTQDENTTQVTGEGPRYGEGEAGGDGVNADDCTGYYDGGSTGWHPTGTTQGADGEPDGEGYVPDAESYGSDY